MGERCLPWATGISVLLIAGVPLLGACGVIPSSGQQTVRVVMAEWTIKPSANTVSPGKVSFEVVNQGKEEHELVILRTDLAPTALKMRANEDKVDEDASGQNVGEVEDVAAGKSKTGSFDLPAGRYLLVCNVIGHYGAGMVTSFEVRP